MLIPQKALPSAPRNFDRSSEKKKRWRTTPLTWQPIRISAKTSTQVTPGIYSISRVCCKRETPSVFGHPRRRSSWNGLYYRMRGSYLINARTQVHPVSRIGYESDSLEEGNLPGMNDAARFPAPNATSSRFGEIEYWNLDEFCFAAAIESRKPAMQINLTRRWKNCTSKAQKAVRLAISIYSKKKDAGEGQNAHTTQ